MILCEIVATRHLMKHLESSPNVILFSNSRVSRFAGLEMNGARKSKKVNGIDLRIAELNYLATRISKHRCTDTLPERV